MAVEARPGGGTEPRVTMAQPFKVAAHKNLTAVDPSSIVRIMSAIRRCCAMAGAVLAAASLVACSRTTPEPPPQTDTPFNPVATIREIMNSVIDPSVDEVWNAVATTVDHAGMTEHAPKTDEDWAELRRHALIVSEAANLLMMPNRPVAAPGAPSLAPGIELTPEEIRALIDKNPDAWNSYVGQLQDSLTPVLAAIDARDADALFELGEKIDATCENCHSVFWYPNAGAATR
jgi:hypothetical protein